MVTRLLFPLLALTLLLPAQDAEAKPKKTSRRAARAQAAFEKAKALFDADEFEAALVYFKEAYDQSNRRPSTIIALAQCERVLKRYDDALLHFREYLTKNPPEAEAKKVRETIQIVEELKAIEEREQALARASPEPELVPPGPAAREERPELAAAPPPPLELEEPQRGLLESPVFWIVVGSVLAAGGAAAGIAVAVSGEREPYGGSSGVVAQPNIR